MPLEEIEPGPPARQARALSVTPWPPGEITTRSKKLTQRDNVDDRDDGSDDDVAEEHRVDRVVDVDAVVHSGNADPEKDQLDEFRRHDRRQHPG